MVTAYIKGPACGWGSVPLFSSTFPSQSRGPEEQGVGDVCSGIGPPSPWQPLGQATAASPRRCQPRDRFSAHGNLGPSQEHGPDGGKEKGQGGGLARALPRSPGHRMKSGPGLQSPAPGAGSQGPGQTVVLPTESWKWEPGEACRR